MLLIERIKKCTCKRRLNSFISRCLYKKHNNKFWWKMHTIFHQTNASSPKTHAITLKKAKAPTFMLLIRGTLQPASQRPCLSARCLATSFPTCTGRRGRKTRTRRSSQTSDRYVVLDSVHLSPPAALFTMAVHMWSAPSLSDWTFIPLVKHTDVYLTTWSEREVLKFKTNFCGDKIRWITVNACTYAFIKACIYSWLFFLWVAAVP